MSYKSLNPMKAVSISFSLGQAGKVFLCVCMCVWLSMLLQKVCSSNIRFSEFASSRWFTDPYQLALQYQQRVYIFCRCRIMYFQNTLSQFSFSTLISINYQFLQKLKLTFLVLLLLPSDGKTEIKDCEIIADINCFRMPLQL